jgi:hypothetical protein
VNESAWKEKKISFLEGDSQFQLGAMSEVPIKELIHLLFGALSSVN